MKTKWMTVLGFLALAAAGLAGCRGPTTTIVVDPASGSVSYDSDKNVNIKGLRAEVKTDGTRTLTIDEANGDAAAAAKGQAELVKAQGESVRGVFGDVLGLLKALAEAQASRPNPTNPTN